MRLRSTRLFAPLLAAVLLAVGLFGGGLTPSASAQDDFQTASHGARITVHNAVCDSEVWDIFGECHDDRLSGSPFFVAGVTRITDANGVATWEPGQGTHELKQDIDVWMQYDGAYVFCSNQVTGEVLWNGPIDDTTSVTFTTTAGQEVVCDWYNLT
ncbi:MAG: hypothetical protein ACRDJH_22610 [Thermomicrobiales bacterium]